MNLLLVIILILTDAFFYGYCYEHKIKGSKHSIGIFGGKISNSLYNLFNPLIYLLFREYPFRGNTYVPFYRLLVQWPLDILALLYLWYNGSEISFFGYYAGTFQFYGMVLAIYFEFKEYGYYVVLDQLKHVKKEFEVKARDIPRKNIFSFGYTYWLERIYFSGAWLFMPYFSYNKFESSALGGLIILILSNFF